MREKNPSESWQKSRRQILEILTQLDQPSWVEIWKRAKACKLHYNTFKKHMEKLIEDKVVRVKINEKKMPPEPVYVFDKDRLGLEVMFKEDVASFIGEAPRQHFIDLGLHGEQLYISDEREFLKGLWKLDKHEEEVYRKWRTATRELWRLYENRWIDFVLTKNFPKEKATIIKYEEALFDYYNMHFKSLLSNKAEDAELEKALYIPSDFKELKENLEMIRDRKVPSSSIYLEDQQLWDNLGSCLVLTMPRMKKAWTKEQLAEKQRLEQFLSENEKLYERYKKQLLSGPKFCIVLPFFGFYDYWEKRAKMQRTLPPSVSLQLSRDLGDLSQKYLDDLEKGVRSSMQNQNKHQAAFACNQCMRIFKTKDRCEQHIRKTEKVLDKPSVEALVIKMPGSYYEEALKEISSIKGETFFRHPVQRNMGQRIE